MVQVSVPRRITRFLRKRRSIRSSQVALQGDIEPASTRTTISQLIASSLEQTAAPQEHTITGQESVEQVSGVLRRKVGRYLLANEIAVGGMATVYLGLLEGAAGFHRPVAIKRLRGPMLASDESKQALLKEAWLGVHIRHPNVVPVLDLVEEDGALYLVMEYVLGETLARLVHAGGALPVDHVATIMIDVLHGLHAAHSATSITGERMCVIHRDVSPQNIIVGVDGVTRVLDFGVAKSTPGEPSTCGYVKGKFGYIAPEQFLGEPLDARTDVFGAGVVLWEALTGRRLFTGDDPVEAVFRVVDQGIPPASAFNKHVPPALDELIAHALQRNPDQRLRTAEQFATQLGEIVQPARLKEVARYTEKTAAVSVGIQRSLLVQLAERYPELHVSSAFSTSFESGVTRAIDEAAAPPQDLGQRRAPSFGPVHAFALGALVAALLGLFLGLAWQRGGHSTDESALSPPQPPAAAVTRTDAASPARGPASDEGDENQEPVREASEDPGAQAGQTPRPAPQTGLPVRAAAATTPPASRISVRQPSSPPQPSSPMARWRALLPIVPDVPLSAEEPGVEAPPAPDCNPPYSYDSSGIKRIKPECPLNR